MAIPLLISMAVIGASVMFPPKSKNSGTTESSTRSLLLTIGVESNQSLLAGIAMGVGLSWALNYELKRVRLYERIRLAIQGWLRPLLLQQVPPPGKTFSVLSHANVTRQPNSSADNSDSCQEHIQTIISSDTSPTSSLWVSTIRIPPRCQLDMKPSNGLELFYVLQGSGEWGSQQTKSTAATENDDSVTTWESIVAGEALVVEPNRTRWIANTSRLEDLVILRSSDAGHLHRQAGYDEIVPISSSSGDSAVSSAVANSVSAMISSGLEMLGGYMGTLTTKQEEKRTTGN